MAKAKKVDTSHDDERRQLCIEACNEWFENHQNADLKKAYIAGMAEIFKNVEKYNLKWVRPPKHIDKVKEVINYLNERAFTCYEYDSQIAISTISALINKGRSVAEMKMVIDKKIDQWLPKPDLRPYIRPQTLFGNKFEQYLNEPSINGGGPNSAGNSGNKMGGNKQRGDAVQTLDGLKLDRNDNLFKPTQ